MATDLRHNHDAEKPTEIELYDITRKQRRRYIAANPSKFISLGKKKIEES